MTIQRLVFYSLILVLASCAAIKSDGDSPFAIGWPTPNGPVGIAYGTNAMTECIQVAKAYETCIRQFSTAMCDMNYRKARDECTSGTVVPGTMPSLPADAFQHKGMGEHESDTTEDESESDNSVVSDFSRQGVNESKSPTTRSTSRSSNFAYARGASPQQVNLYAAISCAGSLISTSMRIICSNRELLENDLFISKYFSSLTNPDSDKSKYQEAVKRQMLYQDGLQSCNDRVCIMRFMTMFANRFRISIPYKNFRN